VFRLATRGGVPRGVGCRLLQLLPTLGTIEKISLRMAARRAAKADRGPAGHRDGTVAGRTIIQCQGQRRPSPHNRCPCSLLPGSHWYADQAPVPRCFRVVADNGEPEAGSAWPHCRQPTTERGCPSPVRTRVRFFTWISVPPNLGSIIAEGTGQLVGFQTISRKSLEQLSKWVHCIARIVGGETLIRNKQTGGSS
jgi:hypothetical protein